MFNSEILKQIMPKCPEDRLTDYAAGLRQTMQSYNITTVTRAAAFLATLAIESGELRYLEELATGEAYEGRTDLGNTELGDGARYKGRGFIQLTGRKNYADAGRWLTLPLVDEPEMAAIYHHALDIAGWYWQSRKINAMADKSDFAAVTRAVNGGLTHFAARKRYFDRAVDVLSLHAGLEL